MLLAVLFDFDGIIIDSEPCHYRSLVELLAPFGAALTWEEYRGRYLGLPDYECIYQILSDAGHQPDESLMQSLFERKAQVFDCFLRHHCELVPGVFAFITALQRRGISTAICSGALRHEIYFMLERYGLENLFPVVVAAEDVTRCKPDPQGYQLCLERLNTHLRLADPITPEQCLVVEDSTRGIAAAQAAAMPCLALATSYPRDQLLHADFTAESFAEFAWEKLL